MCLTAYKDLADRGYLAHARYVIDPHTKRTCYEMPNVDFRADFETTVKRTLTARQWRIFTLYFVSEIDWPAIAAELGMDRGQFFHEVYRIEAKLGRRLAELEPYSLFPIGRYFTASPKGLNHAKSAA
ncbi:MAG: hypothetical protein IT160_07145 [Bryobacterales bacterium]|nr:hypothetical protein [Bryobacterales bacterium]